MLVLLIAVAKAELSEVVALIDLGKDYLLWLKSLIKAYRQLRVANLGNIIILLSSSLEVDLVWLLFLQAGRQFDSLGSLFLVLEKGTPGAFRSFGAVA